MVKWSLDGPLSELYSTNPARQRRWWPLLKIEDLTFIFLSDFDAVFSLDSLLNYLSVVCQRI